MRKSILFYLLFFVSTLTGFAQLQPGLAGLLQYKMDQAVETKGLDGLTASIIMPSGCTWDAVSGLANTNDSVDFDRKWHIGSAGKVFTATVLLQLHEEGQLSIYDSIGTYLNMGDFPHVDGSQTLQMFMNHTTDLTSNYSSNPRSKLWDDIWSDRSKIWSAKDVVSAPYDPAATPNPQREHRYVGLANYIFLGLVIEAVTQKDLQTVYTERIFTPYNLTFTKTTINGLNMNELNGVYNNQTPVSHLSHNSYLSTRGGGGCIISNAENVTHFFHDLYSGNVLEDSSLKIMQARTKGEPTLLPGTCLSYVASYYGLGTLILKVSKAGSNDTMTLYGHTGNGLGAGMSFYSPDLRLSFSLMTNDFTEQQDLILLYIDMYCELLSAVQGQPCLVGVNEESKPEVQVYPNPGTQHLTIRSTDNIEIEQAMIYDLHGQRLWHNTQKATAYNIKVETLPAGLYHVYLYTGKGLTITKWIKQ